MPVASGLGSASDDARALLNDAPYGYLALTGESGPFSFPVSFAIHGQSVVFHSGEGRKSEALVRDPRAALTVTTDPRLVVTQSACGCTFDFYSVLVEGEVRPLTDQGERDSALRALVAKYRPGDEVQRFESAVLARTRVYALEIRSLSEKSHRR